MDEMDINAEIARIELDTMEHTRQWLIDNPGHTIEDLWDILEVWHSNNIGTAIMSAAKVLGPVWAGEKVAEVMGYLAEVAADVESSYQLTRRAAQMADDMAT